MPTRSVLASFLRDWKRLTPHQQRQFLVALKQFVAGLKETEPALDPRLRVKRIQGYPGIWEMSWAPDGRATFEYGDEVRPGQPHIVWRRVGTHAIFRRP